MIYDKALQIGIPYNQINMLTAAEILQLWVYKAAREAVKHGKRD